MSQSLHFLVVKYLHKNTSLSLWFFKNCITYSEKKGLIRKQVTDYKNIPYGYDNSMLMIKLAC